MPGDGSAGNSEQDPAGILGTLKHTLPTLLSEREWAAPTLKSLQRQDHLPGGEAQEEQSGKTLETPVPESRASKNGDV